MLNETNKLTTFS